MVQPKPMRLAHSALAALIKDQNLSSVKQFIVALVNMSNLQLSAPALFSRTNSFIAAATRAKQLIFSRHGESSAAPLPRNRKHLLGVLGTFFQKRQRASLPEGAAFKRPHPPFPRQGDAVSKGKSRAEFCAEVCLLNSKSDNFRISKGNSALYYCSKLLGNGGSGGGARGVCA
jgi:hypothetical protein